MLSDPQKRAIYDQFGEDGLKAGTPPPSASTHGAGAHGFRFNPRSAEEIFSEIFGGAFPGAGPRTPGGGVPPGFPGFGGTAGPGEASSAGLQRKAPTIERQLACSLEKPGDDDAGEEPPPQIGRLRVRLRVCDAGAGDAGGERKEGSYFVLEVAAGVARGLPILRR